jgi:formimidoylglutamate deiminase
MGNQRSEYFAVGHPLDAVIYQADEPLLQQAGDHALQAIVYTADASAIRGTLIDGAWTYRNF